MKTLAQGYVWWPSLDVDIELFVQQFHTCQQSHPQPPIAPIHFWEVPKQPWNHFHLDFASPFLGNMFLVLVDAYFKWLDVIVMKSITTTAMVD